ncbi:proteasome complex subunit Rpn13 ubiquitin receptor-domain-containing protein [Myxozyma melibiosi]|uniref:Proteasome complex subunit Rpn13 ubiquitin receptor-domain-containing protein n=1 Tax=Myxozyma melibiosi TaxID=54550 RepID=A0ABR1FBQ9_9ASCO
MSSDTVTLLTFKAGKVEFNPPSKHLKPLPQKGKITLQKSTDEESPLLSFIWEPRGSSKNDPTVERDELMIFPGEAEWLPVAQCTTGRVYVLKFNSSSQRSFFWMQEAPSGDILNEISENDLKIATRINTLLEDIDAEEVDILEEQSGASGDDVEMEDLPTNTGDSAQQQASLSSLINSIVIPPSSSSTSSGAPIHDITDAITPKQMAQFVDSLDASDPRLTNLYNFLPAEIPKTKPELLRVLQSPQFLQGINSLSQTFRSAEGTNAGQLVAHELGLPYRGEGIEAFLRAIRAAIQEEKDRDHEMQE